MDVVSKGKVLTYQYGDYKIELKPTSGNFELLVNGEVQATTKGGIKFQLSSDIHLTTKLPSGEDVLAIKRAKALTEEEIILFVGQLLSPQ
ncbi:MAG: hypothetical protein FWH28_00440 [Clostridiales bacterium]|nr:hypothetical protein [Clostridiales bacterium]